MLRKTSEVESCRLGFFLLTGRRNQFIYLLGLTANYHYQQIDHKSSKGSRILSDQHFVRFL